MKEYKLHLNLDLIANLTLFDMKNLYYFFLQYFLIFKITVFELLFEYNFYK